MEAFILYLIRASVYLLVFGVGYYLLLARQNGTAFKRFYILLSFVLSLGLAGFGTITVNTPPGLMTESITMLLPEIVVVGTGDGLSESGSWLISLKDFVLFWWFVPLGLMGIFLMSLLIKVRKLAITIQNNSSEKLGEVELVVLSDNSSPFSFFHWIFIPGSLRQSEHFQKVITHEKAHYLLRHSWDVMFLEIMRLFFWFHPIYYFLKSDMQALHEFDADSYALKKYERSDYQRALLDFALGAHYLPITNPFNVSTIKKRFIMMNKNQKTNVKSLWIRLIIILPAILMVFALQSFSGISKTADLQMVIADQPDPSNDASDGVFTEVEDDPEFPGGQAALMKFLQENLTYPAKARTDSVQGTVFVSFVVEKDGKLSNTKILRAVSPELDAETIRVIQAMPNWKPGYQRGEAVRVQYNLPIRFVLSTN